MYKTCFFLCLFALLGTMPALAAEQHHTKAHCSPLDTMGPLTEEENSALEKWLEQLDPDQKDKAMHIIQEARPQVQELHDRIQGKMIELESLSYDQATSPETLPRLGQELQELRDALHVTLHGLNQRMKREVGTGPGAPHTRGCSMRHSNKFFGKKPADWQSEAGSDR